jgi:hypothetical protein
MTDFDFNGLFLGKRCMELLIGKRLLFRHVPISELLGFGVLDFRWYLSFAVLDFGLNLELWCLQYFKKANTTQNPNVLGKFWYCNMATSIEVCCGKVVVPMFQI